MKILPINYGGHYSFEKLMVKLKSLSGRVLNPILLKAFLLYELLKEQDTPVAVKATIIVALGYLVCPVDAVPDMLPGGFVDDIALMAGLIASIDGLITPDVRRKSEQRAANFTSNNGVEEGGS